MAASNGPVSDVLLTFVGHQGWMISHDATNVLLDPLLIAPFGQTPEVPFTVWPPRTVDLALMPAPDAIVVSHEHLDHLSLRTLNFFPRDVPIFIEECVPWPVRDAVEHLGFVVTTIYPDDPTTIGTLTFRFYRPGVGTVAWESRATQFEVHRSDDPDLTVFFAADALLSDAYVGHVLDGSRPTPVAVVAANNSQLVPGDISGSRSNLLPIPRGGSTTAMALVNEIERYVARLPGEPAVIVCGDGFIEADSPHGPYAWSDNHRTCCLASELSTRQWWGPKPGDTATVTRDGLTVGGGSAWLSVDVDAERAGWEKHKSFSAKPVRPPLVPLITTDMTEQEVDTAIRVVDHELDAAARSLLHSKLGQAILDTVTWFDRPTSPRRFVIRLLVTEHTPAVQWAYDMRTGRFERDATEPEHLLSEFPVGIEMWLSDFVAMTTGRLPVWELVGGASRQWHPGGVYASPAAWFYVNWGEQTRPDLAAIHYRIALDQIANEDRSPTMRSATTAASSPSSLSPV